MKSGIYRISNLVNGRIYIGSASDIRGRWAAHKSALANGKHENAHLQAAWIKYGESSFSFEILERVPKEQLHLREEAWFAATNCHRDNGGYNISPFAGTCRGVKHSDESRRNMSLAKKGRPARNKGVPASLEARAKMSRYHRERASTEEGAAMLAEKRKLAASEPALTKMSKTKTGKKMSAESKAKMAASHAKYWQEASPEDRAARAVWRGKPRPEHGAKLKGKPRHEKRSMTFEQAEEVRASKAAGATYSTLTKTFGLDRATLHAIVTRKTYAIP